MLNLHAQLYPGKPKYGNDTAELRRQWFAAALEQVGRLPGLSSLALPAHIGCASAGGDWGAYLQLIKDFAARNRGVRVVLYELPPPGAKRPRT